MDAHNNAADKKAPNVSGTLVHMTKRMYSHNDTSLRT